jgi:hypothetical protein
MAQPYEAQKARFSSLQSNHHKLLNTLKTEKFNTHQLLQLVKINETLDILEAQIIDFNENNCNINESDMDTIKKTNQTIDFLKPIAILHRFLLDINH